MVKSEWLNPSSWRLRFQILNRAVLCRPQTHRQLEYDSG